MLAVFKSGGKQYAVKAGQILRVEKLKGKKGDTVSFNDILAVTDSSNHTFGTPIIKEAAVNAKILEQIRDKKIIVFKKRKRQNYRSTQGHRQDLTVLHIESITLGDKKSTVLKKETKAKKNESISTSVAEKKISKTKKIVKKKAAPVKSAVKKTTEKKIIKKKTTGSKKIG